MLCSEHFKPDDFDRIGKIVRFRERAKPSVFSFLNHLQRTGISPGQKGLITVSHTLLKVFVFW